MTPVVIAAPVVTEAAAPVALKLHKGQATVSKSTAQFRVCVTGRRWGKTTLDKAEAMVEFGTPGLVWFLAPTYDMARDLMWEPIRALTPRAWLRGNRTKRGWSSTRSGAVASPASRSSIPIACVAAVRARSSATSSRTGRTASAHGKKSSCRRC
jgi:hypothetical protein